MSPSPLYAGVELGGTKCICVLGTGPENILEQLFIPTGDNPDLALSQMEAAFRSWHIEHGAIRALGVASFGPIDLNRKSSTYGYITSTPKPGWQNTNVAGRLLNGYRKLGLSSLALGVDTDVNGAALAEGRWGAARGLNNHAYITVGTGVGVGLVVANHAVHGISHPEVGHIRIARMPGDTWPGSCPFHGDCVEGLVSGTAIQARSAVQDENIVWESVAHGLAQLVHSLVVTTAPQRVIIGGGVMSAHSHLFPLIREKLLISLNGYLKIPALIEGIDDYVVPPGLDTQSGPLGALAVAMDATQAL
ncbi:MAG TPA: ROK family protein [Steroidobacteraceae bacterium]|jgi:fructokinase|nr:ROK family protein [Steroidobacteraceae bacterium]